MNGFMIAFYIILVVVAYGGIFIFQDMPGFLPFFYIALFVIAVGGGFLFGGSNSRDEDCVRYSSFASDC